MGKVIGKDKNIIAGATIYLSKVENNDNVSYSTTDDDGLFTISFKKNNVKITINALGYKLIEKLIVYDSSIDTLKFTFEMEIETILLNDVIIKSEKFIKVKKDTIRYNLDHFLIGNEIVIEDALKKLPGITVESNGTIKYGNQEIEKVMVDGEDFFEKAVGRLGLACVESPVLERCVGAVDPGPSACRLGVVRSATVLSEPDPRSVSRDAIVVPPHRRV